jgi:hypothetical protein
VIGRDRRAKDMTERPMITQPRRHRPLLSAALVVFATLWLTACTQIPELDKAVPNWVHKADFPELTALDPSVTTKTLPQDDSEKIAQEMTARQDRLERKAKRLNSPVLDNATQTRMNNGISQ